MRAHKRDRMWILRYFATECAWNCSCTWAVEIRHAVCTTLRHACARVALHSTVLTIVDAEHVTKLLIMQSCHFSLLKWEVSDDRADLMMATILSLNLATDTFNCFLCVLMQILDVVRPRAILQQKGGCSFVRRAQSIILGTTTSRSWTLSLLSCMRCGSIFW